MLHIGSRGVLPLYAEMTKRFAAAGHRVIVVCDEADARFPAQVRERVQPWAEDVINFDDVDRRVSVPSLSKLCSTLKVLWNCLFDANYRQAAKDNQFKSLLIGQRRRCEAASDIVRTWNPQALVVAEDGISGNVWLIEAARRRRIRVVDCPFGFGTRRDLDSVLHRRAEGEGIVYPTGPAGEVVKERYAHWLHRGNSDPELKGAIMYAPAYILVRELLGLSLRDPWVIHGGFADVMAVESDAMHEHYVREGLPREKLHAAGTVYCDLIAEALVTDEVYSNARETNTRIEPGVTRVLISWPPSYHADRAHLCEFDTYEALTDGTIRAMVDAGASVTVSVHPSAAAEVRSHIVELGAAVDDDYLLSLIPRHDVFVSCFSSTTRWAIAAGKPVINYDFYGFGLNDYEGVDGAILVENSQAFQAAVDRIVNQPGAFEALADAQAEAAPTWGVLDGKNFERIHALVIDQ